MGTEVSALREKLLAVAQGVTGNSMVRFETTPQRDSLALVAVGLAENDRKDITPRLPDPLACQMAGNFEAQFP